MMQKVNAITIVVKDLTGLKNFYIKVFGWAVQAENEEVIMFKLNGIMLTLCTAELFRTYTGVDPGMPENKNAYYTVNFSSVAEVEDNFTRLEDAGARVIKKPAHTFWGGYSGFIADPENNMWEICYNPIPGTRA